MKNLLLLVSILCLSSVLHAQITIQRLNDSTKAQYCIAYGQCVSWKWERSEVFYGIDFGQPGLDDMNRTLYRRLGEGDSSVLMKNPETGTNIFTSPVSFLNFMANNGWELLPNRDVPTKTTAATNYSSLFWFKRKNP